MNFIAEQLEKRLVAHPDQAFLFDEVTPKGITNAYTYEISGRIYAYLKGQGIGKEDFVLIKLPRGVQPVLAMFGVWRAGAVWVLVEDTYAPERIEYIRKDCGCRLVLDAAAWETAMMTEPLAGYADVADHDAAYAVYTSGSMGHPKGVLHEYGNLPEAAASCSWDGQSMVPDDIRYACPAPLNFVAAVTIVLKEVCLEHGRLYIPSYATLKNPVRFRSYLLENRISGMFMTPSYLRVLGADMGPYLKYLIMGAEPVNGVEPGDRTFYNFYEMSETGYGVTIFKIDRAYDICPIGKPQFDKNIYILGEDGTEVADGEIGELCVDNPYVRGYINLPEQTADVFRNGIYHSGDLAKRLPDGNIVLLGRMTDMIKINGNRVEPAEIEAAVKAVLDINWCAVRGFEDGENSFIAAYYTADIPEIDTKAVNEALLQRLPYYMLPQYYVRISSVPQKETGKLDRLALPKPGAGDYVTDYVAPTNETERALCQAMAAVLKMERIGINDDFYELGGDSLASMQVIASCGLRGLNATDIFRGRTPKAVAELYQGAYMGNLVGEYDELNEKAKTVSHPLTAEQTYMVDYQMYTPLSTMYNLFTMIKVETGRLEPEEVAQAVTKVLRNHPALATLFTINDDGEIEQSYHPEIVEDVCVEKYWQFDFDQVKDELVTPYKIIGSPLYRCRLFETEKGLYLFFDVHHTIFDGMSFKVFMDNLRKAVAGEELPTDYYYLMLAQRKAAEKTPLYEEAKRYFESVYGGGDWVYHPQTDHETRDNALGNLDVDLDINAETLAKAEKALKLSRNEFFIAAYLIALSLATKSRAVQASWIYNGREDLQMLSSCGLLFHDLPVAMRFADAMDVWDIYVEVQKQVRKAIEYAVYPYKAKNVSVVTDDVSCILYQSDIHEAGEMFEQVAIRQNNAASQTILDAEVIDGNDGPRLALHYAASRYDAETIRAFAEILVKVAAQLVVHTMPHTFTFGELREDVLGRTPFFKRILGKDW